MAVDPKSVRKGGKAYFALAMDGYGAEFGPSRGPRDFVPRRFFGCRPAEREAPLVMPASKNPHTTGRSVTLPNGSGPTVANLFVCGSADRAAAPLRRWTRCRN